MTTALLLALILGSVEGLVDVATSLGTILGQDFGSVQQFMGIPYALPPIGDKRLAPTVDWRTGYAGGTFHTGNTVFC